MRTPECPRCGNDRARLRAVIYECHMCKTWFEDEEALNERDSEPSQTRRL